jgi:PleD family two-component response regulator
MAFAPGLSGEQAIRVGQTMAERVRELRIHHPRSAILRYISISVGVSAVVPEQNNDPVSLLERSQQQLKLAKNAGRNRAA